jgi:hypothetical protein
MKRVIAAAALSVAFLGVSSFAAEPAPPFSNGPVWDVQHIRTKDGHFDDYMKWVSTVWKAYQVAWMKAGYTIGYKVYVVVDPRSDEPDVLLCTEYKNMAAMDVPVAEQYAFAAKHFGATAQQDKAQADRGSIRTALGDVLLREVDLN